MPKPNIPEDAPLAGVRVADFSRVLAGPFCTRILADLGAEVIKVEPPDGDLSRRLGARRGGMSGYYMQQNCGKLNVSIDLRRSPGAELARRLVERSDILVENFRPGVMESLGLGQKPLRELNPSLIYCAISGFGHDSPWRDRRAFAGIAHAATGMLHRQATAGRNDPVDSVLAVGDTTSGMQAVIAILAALRMRERTGTGQFIDMAMHDALLATQEAANFHLFSDETTEHDFLSSWIYRCGDEFIAVPDDPRAHWEKFTALMEAPELLTDVRYNDHIKRAAVLDELEALIQGWIAAQESASQVVARLHAAGMPAARIVTMSEALESEQTQAREMTREIEDRCGNCVPVLDSPYRYSDASAGVRGVPAFRGEDNREVLSEVLGLDEKAIEDLERAGVISARVPEN